jgi:hypothetical protein
MTHLLSFGCTHSRCTMGDNTTTRPGGRFWPGLCAPTPTTPAPIILDLGIETFDHSNTEIFEHLNVVDTGTGGFSHRSAPRRMADRPKNQR